MMSPEMQRKIDSQLAQIPNGEAGINEIMTGLTTRLTLTEDQQNDIRPTVEDTVANMEKSVDRFRDKQLTPMALAMQIQMAGKKAAVLIEPILTQEQLVEYKKMQLEQRREMMKAMTTARTAGGAQR
jgi:hypothetical protein